MVNLISNTCQAPQTQSLLIPKPDPMMGFMDTELSDSIDRHKLFDSFKKYTPRGRSSSKLAIPFPALILSLILFRLMVFIGRGFLCGFDNLINGKKADALYSFCRREDVQWQVISRELAKSVLTHHTQKDEQLIFVVDDSIEERFGKNMEGSSTLYDHTTGKFVTAHCVVTLGVTTPHGFIPCDQQPYQGDKDPVIPAFDDGRSTAARNFRVASTLDKNQIARSMVEKAILLGILATILIADAWYATPDNFLFCGKNNLSGIFRLKRNNWKYFYNGKPYSLAQLYAIVERHMTDSKKSRYKTGYLDVEIQTSEGMLAIRLVFSVPKNSSGNKDWVVIGTNNVALKAKEVVELYGARWSIEVWFREAKQNLGWMKMQTSKYTGLLASIYLASIRYLLLYDAARTNGGTSYVEMRHHTIMYIEMLMGMAEAWKNIKPILSSCSDYVAMLNNTPGASNHVNETIKLLESLVFASILTVHDA